MISVIIPYKHHPGRYNLLKLCLARIAKMANSPAMDIEICLHEIYEPDAAPILALNDLYEIDAVDSLTMKKRIDYMATKYPDKIFHRAWALNSAAKRMAKGDILLLMDGDLLLPRGYFDRIPDDGEPMVGWDELYLVNRETTEEIAGDDDTLPTEGVSKTRMPRIDGNAGGITIIGRDIFNEVKGYPEDFRGTWGGEDNAFWLKLVCMGHEFRAYHATVCHLFHGHKTPRFEGIHKKRYEMAEWDKEKWHRIIHGLGDRWGQIDD